MPAARPGSARSIKQLPPQGGRATRRSSADCPLSAPVGLTRRVSLSPADRARKRREPATVRGVHGLPRRGGLPPRRRRSLTPRSSDSTRRPRRRCPSQEVHVHLLETHAEKLETRAEELETHAEELETRAEELERHAEEHEMRVTSHDPRSTARLTRLHERRRHSAPRPPHPPEPETRAEPRAPQCERRPTPTPIPRTIAPRRRIRSPSAPPPAPRPPAPYPPAARGRSDGRSPCVRHPLERRKTDPWAPATSCRGPRRETLIRIRRMICAYSASRVPRPLGGG